MQARKSSNALRRPAAGSLKLTAALAREFVAAESTYERDLALLRQMGVGIARSGTKPVVRLGKTARKEAVLLSDELTVHAGDLKGRFAEAMQAIWHLAEVKRGKRDYVVFQAKKFKPITPHDAGELIAVAHKPFRGVGQKADYLAAIAQKLRAKRK